MFTVKQGYHRVCKSPDKRNNQKTENNARSQSQMQNLFNRTFIPFSVITADQWLGSLGNPVKNTGKYECKVGNHAIGSHSYISGKP